MNVKKDSKKVEELDSKKKVVEEKKEVHFCKDCRWYDKSSEREFHRRVGPIKEGKRSEIIEIRAVCRNKNAKAYNHLVLSKYEKRQCPQWKKENMI